MFAVNIDEVLARRKRGPRGIFETSEKRRELVEFLAEPDHTYKDAAKHFGCSVPWIDKTIARIKAEEKSPVPTTNQGPDAAE